MIPYTWDHRIRRAEQLAAEQPASAEFLLFYSKVARFQKDVYERLKTPATKLAPSSLAPELAPFLRLIQNIGPAAVGEEARKIEQAKTPLNDFLADRDTFFARALLQPYMECVVSRNANSQETTEPRCPYCGEEPQTAVLRGEGDGARRSLMCSLCSSEWIFRRLVCPNCGEEQNDRLPVYKANGIDHVRVEACDSCHTYIKAVDLTKDGHAVPAVDELASVSLDLWAEDQGYAKLKRNLLGM